MRRIVGGVLLVVALATIVAGAAVMIILGPDNRALSGPHQINTAGVAVVTKPSAISWAGPTVSVLAEVPDKKPVFVGLGNAVDVDNYLGKTARLRIDTVKIPWRITTTDVDGSGNVPAAPTALDWWVAGNAGLGGAAITAPLPDEPVSVAVVSVGDSDLEGLTVTTAYDVGGGFGIGAGSIAVGLGLGAIGVAQVRGLPLTLGAQQRDEELDNYWEDELEELWDDEDDWEDDRDPLWDTEWDDWDASREVEPVYVYVDDDGVEHEIPAEDIENYEIIDEGETAVPEPVGTRVPVPAAITNVETAGDIVAEAEEAQPAEEEVVYVFVDEDGVEQVIDADEAQEYEIIEEVELEQPQSSSPGSQPRGRMPWGRKS